MTSVAVIGAGPVGLTTALALTRTGHDVTVFEAGDGLSTESRASTFHPPTLEFLDGLGVADDLIGIGLKAPTMQYRDRNEGVIAEMDLAVLSADTKFPFRLQCEQDKLCRIIAPRVRIEYNKAATRASPEGTVNFADGSSVSADIVVAADGAHSAVRKSLGIAFEGETYTDNYLVVSTSEDVDTMIPGISYVNYISDPDEWLVLLRTPDQWRVLFPVPESEDIDTGEIQRRLRGVHDTGSDWNVLEATKYRVHQRVASTFRVGRVLLAGDAAHINNPLGGLGMNSGIHDAISAAHRIGRGIRTSDLDAELDAYSEVRRTTAIKWVQKSTDDNYRRMRETDPDAVARTRERQRRIAADPVLMREHLIEATLLHVAREAV